MAGCVKLSHFGVLFCATSGVVHIAQMVFSKVIVNMILDKKLLIDFQQEGEQPQQLNHNFGMTLTTEGLDLIDVVLEDRRMFTLMMPIKLGKVVDLDVVRDTRGERAKTSRPVTIVIARFESFDVVVLEPFLQWKVVELTTQSKLAVYFLLTDVEVVDVEET